MTNSSFLFCFHNKKENEIEADGTPISFLVSTVRLDSYEVVEEPLHGILNIMYDQYLQYNHLTIRNKIPSFNTILI